MPDLEISQLPELQGVGLATSDALAIVDTSASETKKVSTKNLIQAGIALIDDGSIPITKVDIPSVAIPDGSITTDKLANGAVTDVKISAVNGSKIVASSITPNKLGTVTDRGLNQSTGSIGIANTVVAGSNAGISWNDQGLITGSTTPIPSADLPVASNVNLGGVSVPANGGLSVTGAGELSITNSVSPTSQGWIAYDQHGLVLSSRELLPTDLPIATTAANGVVSVPAAWGLYIDESGAIGLSNSGITPGSYTKPTVDIYGRVIGYEAFTAGDVPPLDASKITSGQFNGAERLVDRTVTEVKLSDYSTCLIQEGQPSGDYKLGQLWFTPSTSQLRVYGRGSGQQDLWLSVGFGALQQANLRWGGTVNAATSTITSLTNIGVSEGLTAGGPVPQPTDELSGLYFVVDTAGTAITIPNVNGAQATEGDWVLYIDAAQGAVLLDVSAGGGGGGGATTLNGLTDVNITNAAADNLLQYDEISGNWVNVSLISGGTF